MQNPNYFIEKRNFPRFPVHIPLIYMEPNSYESIAAQTHDISQQGLCIVTDKELLRGASLQMRIRMLDNGEEFYWKGCVLWAKPIGFNKYRTGIKLTEERLKPIPIALRTINAQRKYYE